MYLIFLRHAIYEQPKQVPSALLPHPLTSVGRVQATEGAKKITDFIQNHQINFPIKIETSSLLRAYETGTIIKNALENQYNIDILMQETDELTERRLGAMANLTVKAIEEIVNKDPRYPSPPKNWKSTSDYKLPYIGCESLNEAGKRIVNYIEANHFDGLRILVGHGASFRHAAKALNILKAEDIPKLSMHYATPLLFKYVNGKWEHIDGKWKIRDTKDKID